MYTYVQYNIWFSFNLSVVLPVCTLRHIIRYAIVANFFYDLGCSGDLKYVSASRECVESCPCGTYQLFGSCQISKSTNVINIKYINSIINFWNSYLNTKIFLKLMHAYAIVSCTSCIII